MTGHGAGERAHELAVVSSGLHAVAAATWVGGLAAILVLTVGQRLALGELIRRFSPLAAGCLAVVAVTGVVNAAVRVAMPAALVSTGYGALVLGKTACLLGLGAIGLLIRRRLDAGARPLALAAVEVAVMAVALGLAAALASAGP